jgi:hypothetical protein
MLGHIGMARGAADHDLIAFDADVGHAGNARHVHQHGGRGQPQFHRGQQALAAAEELGVGIGL